MNIIEVAEKRELSARKQRLIRKANIPRSCQIARLESPPRGLAPFYKSARKITPIACPSDQVELQNKQWPERGIILQGTKRCGKTFLAAALLRELIETHSATGYFQNVNDLFHELKWAMDRPQGREGLTSERIVRRLCDCEYLVLDDLAAYRATPWQLEEMYYLVNYRLVNLKFTIFTQDTPWDDMRSTVDTDLIAPFERLFGRVMEMCRAPWTLPAQNIVEVQT